MMTGRQSRETRSRRRSVIKAAASRSFHSELFSRVPASSAAAAAAVAAAAMTRRRPNDDRVTLCGCRSGHSSRVTAGSG